MSRLASSKTAQIWAERFAHCERSNAPVAQAYPGRRFALPWAISFCPFGADGSIDAQEFSDHAASNLSLATPATAKMQARATGQGRHGRYASCTASGTCATLQRQIANQKSCLQ